MKGVFVQTYGCQMNASDSDRMKALLRPLGFEAVNEPQDADLVLINTCSIREKAEHKTDSFAHNLKKIKQNRPGVKIGITGCVAQQEKEALRERLPFVDLFLGPDNIDELPWALEEVDRLQEIKKRSSLVRTEFDKESRVWKTQTELLNPGPTAFISVMKGCDHFCSYCVVPLTRGREKSRPIEDVVADVKSLVARGVREITFLGQNINTYGKRSEESLSQLFHRVHDIPDLLRIRFTTSHPGDLKDDLVQAFVDLPKLCSQFHLPFQSGSDRILRAMRRFYTQAQYLERIEALRKARPDISFSTDVIIGFPGETEEDFLETMKVMEAVRFENSYSFLFSPRPGTSAATRPDTTPETVKMERLNRLQNRARTISAELHRAEVGRNVEILIEGPSKKDSQMWTGRTSQNIPVHIPFSDQLKVGTLTSVQIVNSSLTHLSGILPQSAPQRFKIETTTQPVG